MFLVEFHDGQEEGKISAPSSSKRKKCFQNLCQTWKLMIFWSKLLQKLRHLKKFAFQILDRHPPVYPPTPFFVFLPAGGLSVPWGLSPVIPVCLRKFVPSPPRCNPSLNHMCSTLPRTWIIFWQIFRTPVTTTGNPPPDERGRKSGFWSLECKKLAFKCFWTISWYLFLAFLSPSSATFSGFLFASWFFWVHGPKSQISWNLFFNLFFQ